jgi:hypothetical protein
MPELPVLVTLGFRCLDVTDGALARCTSFCTESQFTHVEVILTLPCTRTAECEYCQELAGLTAAARYKLRGLVHMSLSSSYHTRSFTVTGVPGRDAVYSQINRIYTGARSTARWRFYTRALTEVRDAQEVLEFLHSQLHAPFDTWAFYLNFSVLRCLPFQKGCPYSEDYHEWTGGWTCSSLALAAVQRLGILPGVAPSWCTPEMLFRAVVRHPTWLELNGEPGHTKKVVRQTVAECISSQSKRTRTLRRSRREPRV